MRTMGGAPVHLQWRREIAAGVRLGPTIVTAGPIVDGAEPAHDGSLRSANRSHRVNRWTSGSTPNPAARSARRDSSVVVLRSTTTGLDRARRRAGRRMSTMSTHPAP